MPGNRFRCPECDAPIRLSGSEPAGKKVRCPECDALVRPPADGDAPAPAARRRGRSRDDDLDDRPRRSGSRGKTKAQKSNAPVIIAAVVGAVLLVGGGVAVALYTMGKKQDEPAAGGGPVAKAKVAGRPGGAPIPGGAPKTSGTVAVGLNVGNEAPDIEAEDLDGETFKLSDYRGKVVMLDFWGNW